jgi:hypothetical protein
VSAKYHVGRSGIGLVILLPVIILVYLTNPPWSTPGAATAYYSILAFLCITMTASSANRIRIDPSPSNNSLFACTGYASLIFSGAAIFYILTRETPAIHAQTAGVFLNLVAFASTGVLILLYSSLDKLIKKENSIWERRQTPFLIIAFLVIIFMIMMVISRLIENQAIFLIAGYITGAIAVFSYVAAAVLTFRGRELITTNDPIRLTFSFLLFAGASFNHILILPAPSSYWIISMGLISVALVIANVSISYTFLLDIGVRDNIAYGVTIITSVLAVVPFILSHLFEVLFAIEAIPDIGATVLIHISGSVLAGISAYAVYMKSRLRPASGLLAIVFLLLFWMVSELAIVLSHFSPNYGFVTESRIPYICGSIISSIMLTDAIRRVLSPTKDETNQIPIIYVIALVSAPLILLFGEFFRQYIFLGLWGMPETIVGSAMMLGLSFFSLYALLTYILLLTSASGGQWLFDSVGVALASIWVVVVILKANFGYATTGWWVAEAIMFISTIAFSFLLLRMYLIESDELERTGPVASAYSQMLSENIVGHQKAAIDFLSEMAMDSHMSEVRLDSLALILTEVSRANELAKHIQVLLSGTKFQEEDLEATDIIDSITGAMNRSSIPNSVRRYKKNDEEPNVKLVRANSFLVDLFYYLFEGISKRIGVIELLGVEICKQGKNVNSDIEVTLDILVKNDRLDQRQALVKRYIESYSPDVMEFAYSKRLIDLFGGSIKWHMGIASSQCLLITIKITLPSASM